MWAAWRAGTAAAGGSRRHSCAHASVTRGTPAGWLSSSGGGCSIDSPAAGKDVARARLRETLAIDASEVVEGRLDAGDELALDDVLRQGAIAAEGRDTQWEVNGECGPKCGEHESTGATHQLSFWAAAMRMISPAARSATRLKKRASRFISCRPKNQQDARCVTAGKIAAGDGGHVGNRVNTRLDTHKHGVRQQASDAVAVQNDELLD